MKLTKKPDATIVEGKQLRLTITPLENGGVCYDIAAREKNGWVTVLGSERSTVAANKNTKGCGQMMRTSRRIIEFPQELVSAEAKNGIATVILRGKADGHTAEQKMTFGDNDSYINVVSTVKLGHPSRIAAAGTAHVFIPDGMLYSQYEPLDFCWIPHLRRLPEHTIGDHVFRSPAVIFQSGKIMGAIVPDLDVLAKNRPMPTALDARLEIPGMPAPAFWYGFCRYKIDGHVFFKQDEPGRKPCKGDLVYGYDLLAGADEPERHAHRRVAKHLWDRYGAKLIRNVEPQTVTYDEYARRAYGFAFDRGKIWREFDLGGKRAGGTVSVTFAGPAKTKFMNHGEIERMLKMQKLIPGIHGAATDKLLQTEFANDALEFIVHNTTITAPPHILNQSWFCNLRTAYGAFAYSEKLGNASLKDYALKMKELALGAPGDLGFMYSDCYCPDDGDPIWMQGMKAFEAVRDYHLPDNAWTGWWMLRWYEELEKDERLLERAKAVGDALAASQLESGAIPGWVRVRRGVPTAGATLRESAQTAAPGMFLARLARVTGEAKYLKAAESAAKFLIDNIFPDNIWWDYETFFSCSKKDVGMKDAGTGLHCMNNLCIFWTAEMMRELADKTKKKTYLEHGLRALDLMILWQQAWDPPYLSINGFGGFGVMNTDGEWNDARQSMFAECLTAYYELTGEREYFERGVAALRSSFTTMLIPENRAVAPGNMKRFIAKDEGASYENYGHLGFDRCAPGYLMFDWGSGGACSAAARLTRRFGDIYIDAARGNAFGLDLCTAVKYKTGEGSLSLEIDAPHNDGRTLMLKATGLKQGKYKLTVNGAARGTHTAAALRDGIDVEL